jgi:uncharacterized protein
MIIDVHAHVYARPVIRPNPGATPFMSVADQLAVMDRLGIDRAVILPLNDAECPAEPQSLGEVLSICEQHPGRFIPFCNVDPRLPRDPERVTVADFEFVLSQYREAGCRGIGEMTARIPWGCRPMRCMLEAAAMLGLPVTFHTITEAVNSYGVIDEIGLPGLEKMLQSFPDLMLLGHSQGFWSEISGDVTPETKNAYPDAPVQPGGTLPRLFWEYPGLYGDLSAGSGFNALHRDPAHAREFIEEFQDRLLLGLDFCSPINDHRHIQWLTTQRDEGAISGTAYEKIMWQNADRILGLGLAQS